MSLRPLLVFSFIAVAAAVHAAPVHLRCDSVSNPLGIDTPQPRLSWQSDNTERNWMQSAYQVLVASRPELLRRGHADLWTGPVVQSGESASIPYAGPPLHARSRYYWAVRVWDARRHHTQSSEEAWWEMGLLQPSDWEAHWIRWENPGTAADEEGMRWIWMPGQDAAKVTPGTEVTFRREFEMTQTPVRAALFLIARGDWKASVNGHDVGAKPHWGEFDRRDIGAYLVPGKNHVEITVKSPAPPQFGMGAAAPNTPQPAALSALIKVEYDARVDRFATSDDWEARLQASDPGQSAAVLARIHDNGTWGDAGPLPQPAALLRHAFAVNKPVRQARAYATALGAYELFLNGQRVGHDLLTPGFTQFDKRTQYQTYDVTALLKQGSNVAGAVLGNGWFGSGLAWSGEHFKLKPPVRLLTQLEIMYTDGTRDLVCSDHSWLAAQSPILHNEIYAGETYDARLEQPGWDRTGFDDHAWIHAADADAYEGAISSQIGDPPRAGATLHPERVNTPSTGTYVFDMGQNMVGWVALRATGPAGTRVRLRFAEILSPDGNIYTTNLRNADATDTYTLRGGAEEIFRPRFTFHGFRYVEVTGYPGTPGLQDLTGEVISSLSGEPTATLNTSSELVNRMWTLGIWGERSNFLSVPTDCPQRDERLGWMADAAVFWRTGSYNFDTEAITHKWTRDIRDAQRPDGAFTNVSPNIGVGEVEGAPGWGDAGVIVPWTTWIQYGDTAVLRDNWAAMERWMKFVQDANPDFVRKRKVGPDFADWLAPDMSTPKDLIDTAYWALIADLMSQMAHALGDEASAQRYAGVHTSIRTAFQNAYVKPDGTVGPGSQTSYVAALQMKLLPPELEGAAVDKLVSNVESHDWHLTTGFLGTPYLLFALGNHGRLDAAYRLLLSDTYPSWGYMIKKGATTWWERWNGDTGDPSMNSYNHYAFGSVVSWVYQNVVGIDTTSGGPGFHEITIQPHPDARMTAAEGEYHSIYGLIRSGWTAKPGQPFALRVTIPANTSAKIILPVKGQVSENSHEVTSTIENDHSVVRVGSGSYEFAVKGEQ